jgi:hypothetical protein
LLEPPDGADNFSSIGGVKLAQPDNRGPPLAN